MFLSDWLVIDRSHVRLVCLFYNVDQYRLRTGASAQPERAYVQSMHQRMHARSCSEMANCDADGVWCRMAVAVLLRYPSSYQVRRVARSLIVIQTVCGVAWRLQFYSGIHPLTK
jgi:hypothetical protein